ncbi:MAG: hypothetical protein NTV14_06915 [Coprothermobacterota bacterium]|nr:hypothetical protein [Coprothermobacterota bacterium]
MFWRMECYARVGSMRPQEQKGLTIPGTAAPQCGINSEVTETNWV